MPFQELRGSFEPPWTDKRAQQLQQRKQPASFNPELMNRPLGELPLTPPQLFPVALALGF
jgi:hypothetical protein